MKRVWGWFWLSGLVPFLVVVGGVALAAAGLDRAGAYVILAGHAAAPVWTIVGLPEGKPRPVVAFIRSFWPFVLFYSLPVALFVVRSLHEPGPEEPSCGLGFGIMAVIAVFGLAFFAIGGGVGAAIVSLSNRTRHSR